MDDVKPMGWILLLSVVIAVVFLVCRTLLRAGLDASASSLEEKYKTMLSNVPSFDARHTYFSPTAKTYIAIDENALLLMLCNARNGQLVPNVYPISKIVHIALITEGTTSVTGVGSAISTGGAVLGFAKAFSQGFVSSIDLELHFDDTDTPIVRHHVLSSARHGKFEQESKYVRDAVSNAEKIKAVLEVLMRRIATA